MCMCRRPGGGGSPMSYDQEWGGGIRQPLRHSSRQGYGLYQLQCAFGLHVGHYCWRRLEGKGDSFCLACFNQGSQIPEYVHVAKANLKEFLQYKEAMISILYYFKYKPLSWY